LCRSGPRLHYTLLHVDECEPLEYAGAARAAEKLILQAFDGLDWTRLHRLAEQPSPGLARRKLIP
jgi:hypothetical protein